MFPMGDPYSLQFHSDPRSLRQNQRHRLIYNNITTINHMKSNTYIPSQNNKFKHNYTNNININIHNQGIGSNTKSNNSCRKRKYIETLDGTDNEYKQIQLQCEPQKKQHITSQIIRDSWQTKDINRINNNLNGIKNKRKRKFNEMNEYNNDLNDLCDGINKKMKIWDAINNKSYSFNINNNNKKNNNNEIKEEIFNSELIPKIIEYANLYNNNTLIDKLYNNVNNNNTLLNKTRLNKYTGAVVLYKKPEKESWKQLIQKYYQNKNDCNIDWDMNDNNNNGFNKNRFMNSEKMEKIANKGNKNDNENECNDNCMDCD